MRPVPDLPHPGLAGLLSRHVGGDEEARGCGHAFRQAAADSATLDRPGSALRRHCFVRQPPGHQSREAISRALPSARPSVGSQIAGNCCATPTRIADRDTDRSSDRRYRPQSKVDLFDPPSQNSESWVEVKFIPAEQHDIPALSDMPVGSEIVFTSGDPCHVPGFVDVTRVKTVAAGRSGHHAGLGPGSSAWLHRLTGQGPPGPSPGGAGDDFARPLSPRASRPRRHTGLAWSRRPSHACQPVRAATSRPAPKHPSSARNDPENAA